MGGFLSYRGFLAHHWPVWRNAALVLLASWLLLIAVTLQPKPGTPMVAIVFPPWWSGSLALRAAASAHAAIVRTGFLPTIVIVRPAAGDGLAALYRAGGLAALDPLALGGCFARPPFS